MIHSFIYSILWLVLLLLLATVIAVRAAVQYNTAQCSNRYNNTEEYIRTVPLRKNFGQNRVKFLRKFS